MIDWLIVALIAVGSTFGLLAAIGLLRMPDIYMRVQASTKAATLGVSCIVLASVFEFGATGLTVRALLVVAFIFLTAPVAAHMIARAAYTAGAEMWRGTLLDELHDAEESESSLQR